MTTGFAKFLDLTEGPKTNTIEREAEHFAAEAVRVEDGRLTAQAARAKAEAAAADAACVEARLRDARPRGEQFLLVFFFFRIY